jgi:hypothetical protein
MEHTDDPDVAEQIALDHLAEDPHYYSRLAAAGIDGNLRPNQTGGDAPFRITLHQAGDPREDFLCDTLDEASTILTAYQRRHGMGASDMGRSHGLVHDRVTGQPVAKVSYNGRIWPVGSEYA